MNDRLDRYGLTDEEWQRLAPLTPGNARQAHRWNDHRMVVNGILFRTRTGCPWRDPPGELRALEDRGPGDGRQGILRSAANRAWLRKRGITAVMPVKEDQKKNRGAWGRSGVRPPAFDPGR